MDKKSVIGIVVVALIILGFTFYNSHQQKKYQEQLAAYNLRQDSLQAVQDSLDALRTPAPVVADTLDAATLQHAVDSLQTEQNVLRFGHMLVEAQTAEASEFTLENDLLAIDFSTRGGQIKGVALKDKEYTKYASAGERNEQVRLMDPEASRFGLQFALASGVAINTTDYTFDVVWSERETDGTHRIVMELPIDAGAALQYEYIIYNSTMPERDYLVDFRIVLKGMASHMAPGQSTLALDWASRSFQNEKGFQNENTYTTVAWHLPGENSTDDLGRSIDNKSEQVEGTPNWIAFKQQFFSSVLIAPSTFSTAAVACSTPGRDSGFMKDYVATLSLPYTAQMERYDMAFYFGPNKYAILKDVVMTASAEQKAEEVEPLHLERLVPLGWGIFGWVNRWIVIPVFDLLKSWGLGFGLIILILAILVKLITLPLTYRSYISTAKMRVIKPEVDEITKKYPKKEDAMKRQQATMDLYKKAGINPMGGCIPMLIQMPIIIAMFQFFPASIELRGQPFLWADDLSAYDSIINLPFNIPFYGDHISLFALLMAGALFLFSHINYQQSASSQPQMAGMKVMMVYVMPIMMLFWFNSYASGLAYYYFLANLITIGQTILIRRSVNDQKIHAMIKVNSAKAKSKPKSKFQQRFEELQRQQQQAQQQQRKK